jgi:hypothetical protein
MRAKLLKKRAAQSHESAKKQVRRAQGARRTKPVYANSISE